MAARWAGVHAGRAPPRQHDGLQGGRLGSSRQQSCAGTLHRARRLPIMRLARPGSPQACLHHGWWLAAGWACGTCCGTWSACTGPQTPGSSPLRRPSGEAGGPPGLLAPESRPQPQAELESSPPALPGAATHTLRLCNTPGNALLASRRRRRTPNSCPPTKHTHTHMHAYAQSLTLVPTPNAAWPSVAGWRRPPPRRASCLARSGCPACCSMTPSPACWSATPETAAWWSALWELRTPQRRSCATGSATPGGWSLTTVGPPGLASAVLAPASLPAVLACLCLRLAVLAAGACAAPGRRPCVLTACSSPRSPYAKEGAELSLSSCAGLPPGVMQTCWRLCRSAAL
jgi:hypothetical protein